MKKRKLPPGPLIVATAHTRKGLKEAAGLRRGLIDVVEVRLDALAAHPLALDRAISRISLPILLTARHPSEGGSGRMDASSRRHVLSTFLPRAAVIDVELRSIHTMAAVLREASELGLVRIVSFHDFNGTPSLRKLRHLVAAARKTGADIVKVATALRGPRDLAVLLELQASARGAPLAVMGMGPLGKVSRLVLAAAGSRLNYGYLDKPQVSGQWPAPELARRLTEVRL